MPILKLNRRTVTKCKSGKNSYTLRINIPKEIDINEGDIYLFERVSETEIKMTKVS